MKKILTSTIVAFVFLLGVPVFAQMEGFDISALAQELGDEHAALLEQVEAGEITKEEAYNAWQELVDELRTEKDKYFNNRMEAIQEKIEMIAEKNPERAAVLEEKMTTAQERRQERTQMRSQIREQVQSGEITREQARVRFGELQSEAQQTRIMLREDATGFEAGKMENRPEGAPEMGQGQKRGGGGE